MLLRFLLVGLFFSLVYRLLKDLLRSLFRFGTPPKKQATSSKKQPSWHPDKSRIQDAEFRDLNN